MTKYERITSMGVAQLAALLVDVTYYQESAWSQPTYRDYSRNASTTDRKEAIAGTIKWLKSEVSNANH